MLTLGVYVKCQRCAFVVAVVGEAKREYLPVSVMAGPVPTIHVFLTAAKTWMPVTSTDMTTGYFISDSRAA
jgi:hypothetical protein